MIAQLARDLVVCRRSASGETRDEAAQHGSALRQGLHDAADRAHEVVPLRLLLAQLSPPGRSESVELELPILVGRCLPLGRNESVTLQAVQRGVERPVLDDEHVARRLANVGRDPVPVRGPEERGS